MLLQWTKETENKKRGQPHKKLCLSLPMTLDSLTLPRKQAGGETPQWASLEVTEPLMTEAPDSARGGGGRVAAAVPRHRTVPLLDSQTYRQAVWADLSSDRSFITDMRAKGGSWPQSRTGAELEMGDVIMGE